jgi:tetratricopeptide (TPR) repeat protein/SAM-dependent methyltransferase
MNRSERRRQRKKAEKAAKNANRAPAQQALTIPQYLELAVRHHKAGELPQAERIYQQVLQADPDQPVALHLLGVIAHQAGKNDIAVEFITKALAVKPDYAEAHGNLGNMFKERGLLDRALESYHKALAIQPNLAEAHCNLGSTLKGLGRLREAVESYHKALAIKPDYAEAHNNLGIALKEMGKLHEAVSSYRQAIIIKPDMAEAHHNLGKAFRELGKQDEAFASQRRAVALDPEQDLFWAGLAETLDTISFTSADDDLFQGLLQLLERPSVRPFYVIRSIISALHHHPDFSQILALTGSGSAEVGMTYGDAAERLSAIPLFLRIMGLSPIADLKIERMLTVLRRAMMEETVAGKTDETVLQFSAALALQCFTNEYVFPETDEEKEAVELLQQQIATLVEKDRDVPASFVAALGAYRPLYSFFWAQELSDREWTGDIKEVIGRQISEPREERSLRSRIPSLTSIENAVSQSVRKQYEENPYPRWIKIDARDNGGAIGAVLRGAPLRFDLEDYQSPESPEILVAGCGTGQHALDTASRFSNARLLAVDLSLSSLSYALRKTEELGFPNIEYAQADIMGLGSLGRQFDLIESVGVLHHLGDPLAGWQVLTNLLRPGGLMKIGLYSETARRNILSGRSLIAEKGYTTSAEDIRRCRRDIITMAEDGNPKMAEIANKRDFFSLSECRDLLFHVQEHRFTLPQIEEALKVLNLNFLGFEMSDETTLRKFRDSHSSRDALTSIAPWHKFEIENPDVFRGMYLFWCKKI